MRQWLITGKASTELWPANHRYLIARHTNGIVTKALQEGTVRGTRMSMDCYASHPVTDQRRLLYIVSFFTNLGVHCRDLSIGLGT